MEVTDENPIEKYKEILRLLYENWQRKDFNGETEQDVIFAFSYGVKNGILNEKVTNVTENCNGVPVFCVIMEYPFTPYGEEWIKTNFEKSRDTITKSIQEETGKQIVNVIIKIIIFLSGGGVWSLISHFIIHNIFPNFQW